MTPNTYQPPSGEKGNDRMSGLRRRMPASGWLQRARTLLRPKYDGPVSWLWNSGIMRIALFLVIAVGARPVLTSVEIAILASIHMAAIGCGLWYLLTLRHSNKVSAPLTWTQVFVDFSVVAATISFSGGAESDFTFLFVIVILEAGALMGLAQGFVFASLSAAFLIVLNLPVPEWVTELLAYWYNVLIQCISLFFTAMISGYWHQRVSRLKQFQREILDNMSGGFLICDLRGVIIAANRAAAIILERPPDQLLQRPAQEAMVCESGAECPIVTALRDGRNYASYEFYILTGSGSAKLLGLTTNHLYDTRGRETALIASFTDLTAEAQMRQQLQRQNRLAAIGESATELAHEVRNPLTALRVAVEEIGRRLEFEDRTQRLACIALTETRHLNKIVEGFLNFARNPEFHRQAVDIDALAEQEAASIRHSFSDLTVKVMRADNPCIAAGDPTQIRQLLDNIMTNGAEAMDGKGDLAVSLRPGPGHVEIRIEDRGPGIPPDKVARIFEPFYTEKERGVGMGLAICQRIVTMHDGDIRVEARSGGGTRVIIRLPGAHAAGSEG